MWREVTRPIGGAPVLLVCHFSYDKWSDMDKWSGGLGSLVFKAIHHCFLALGYILVHTTIEQGTCSMIWGQLHRAA